MYQLTFSPTDGTVNGVKRLSDGAFISLDENSVDFQAFLVWNAQQAVPLDLNSVSQAILDANAARLIAQEAKAKAIIDNLPSWAIVGGKFDAMLAAANAATNLTQAKAVLVDLITFLKKSHRVIYWDVKNTEE